MVQAISNALGPWGTILGFLLTVAGLIVYFRKWLKTISGEQQQTREFAQTAANAAGNAASSATAARSASQEASKHALNASQSVVELREANGRLITLLPDKDGEVEYLRETNNRLVAELVIQASKHPEDFESPSAPRFPAPETEWEPDETYTTGRHSYAPPEARQLDPSNERNPS